MFPWQNKYPYTDFHEMNLDWIMKTLGELKTEYEKLLAEYNEIYEFYANIEQRIASAINAEMVDVWAEINTRFLAFNSRIVHCETRVNELSDALADMNVILKNYTDSRVTSAKIEMEQYASDLFGELQVQVDELRELIENIPDQIQVFNPVIEDQDNLNNTLSDMYHNSRVIHGISVSEYGAMGITVDEYNAFYMNVTEYAMKAKAILNRFWKWDYNHITGIKNTFGNLISWAVNAIEGTKSINDYNALGYSVNDYDNLGISCLDYLTGNY